MISNKIIEAYNYGFLIGKNLANKQKRWLNNIIFGEKQ